MIEKKIYYSIAELILEIIYPTDNDVSIVLPNFEPFRVEGELCSSKSCEIYISSVDLNFDNKNTRLLSDISIVWGDRFTFYEDDEYYWTLIQYSKEKDKHWKMRSTKHFKYNTIYLGNINEVRGNFLSWFCMVAFAQSSLDHNCVLFHASVVMNEKYGYGFLGKSGTGKSTHSRLWLDTFEEFTLLNDDNPAIRVINNEVFVYGTPWSGKTQCYISESRKLKGLVRLRQFPENVFEQKKNKEALLSLLPSCSAIRWNLSLYSAMTNILIDIINYVPIAELKCLPNREAAEICYTELKKI